MQQETEFFVKSLQKVYNIHWIGKGGIVTYG